MDNNGSGRKKNITNQSKGVHKRGSGLGTGPVGRKDGYQGRKGSSAKGGGGTTKAVASPIAVILIIVLAILGGGNGLGGLFGGGSGFSGASFVGDNVSSGWKNGNNTGKLNQKISPLAEEKRTKILGDGKDTVTIMVYMCGTDLESKHGMASNDLNEMMKATLDKKVNILIYTGGCKKWKTKEISNQVNQIYQISGGKLKQLSADDGNRSMTDPATLTSFIQYCDSHYPANRKNLIFWDHGGGSLSGYGYDEKHTQSGSMDLTQINQALKNAGVTFDFIGFDACLMATMETALMTGNYADYLIASEETEPGIGWYYTDWLNALSKNTSMPTLEIGKNIVDGFVDECARKCRGQKTTLSVIDLAEMKATVPEKLVAFSKETASAIQGNDYQKISDARAGSREFSPSSVIDQVDLVSLAMNIGTDKAKELAQALLDCVKYNRTSSNMTNAYGVSVYFPYRNTRKVNSAAGIHNNLGISNEYTKCIKAFAGMENAGQIAAGGSASPVSSLSGGVSVLVSSIGTDAISSVLSSFLSGRSVPGLDQDQASYMEESDVFDVNAAAKYVAGHQFDASKLKWQESGDKHVMSLSKKQWGMIQSLQMNLFFDDGEGYIDLGLDNVYQFTKDGKLIGESDGTWLAIDGQPVAYYFESEVKDGDSSTITGRVPVMLNGERANLILIFDDSNPYGFIAGAVYDYHNGETETAPKQITELTEGDTIDFVCDYYSYEGEYQDSYFLGEQTTYRPSMEISNVAVGDSSMITYLLTDLYGQEYWTPVVPE